MMNIFLKLSVYVSVTVAILLQSSIISAHSNNDLDSIQITLHRWANGLVNDDPSAVEEQLAGDFVGLNNQSRHDYLARIQENSEIEGVILKHANYEFIDGGVGVSPIVVYFDGFSIPHSVLLAKENGVWKIASISLDKIPSDLIAKNLPEHFQTTPVTIDLRDAQTGKPVFARVHIVDEQGEYWPPRGHQKNIRIGWREDVGGDVRVDGKTYAYVENGFVVDLPMGKYRIDAEKGMEYKPESSSFQVLSGENESVTLFFKRWSNMERQGWYSGDTHTHFLNDYSALIEAKAEDLNVINVLATKWGELITNAKEVTGAPSLISGADNIVFFNEETRHNFLGHTILHPIKDLIYPLTWGGASEGVPGGYDFPPMAYQADKAHAQGGLVTWAHFGHRMEAPIDVALGKVDSLDIFTWGDAFSPSITAVDGQNIPGPIEYWYKFLNTGFRLPATAGTDKMVNTQVSGSIRTYVYIGDKAFTYGGWIDGIRHGRTFITTGPMISLKVNNQEIGSALNLIPGEVAHIEASVHAPYDRYPVEKFELIKNGRVIARQVNSDRSEIMRFSEDIKIEKSAWFAVRAYGPKILPYNTWPAAGSWADGSPVMAHTSPVYIDVAGTELWSQEDAVFLAGRCDVVINWAKTKAKYHTEEQRAEVVSLFERAKAVYTRQASD